VAYSESLALRTRDALARKRNIEEKRMFGGVGFLMNGHILVGVWKQSLVVRLGEPQASESLREPHVGEFDITGRAMKGWVLVGPEGLEGDDQLAGWIQKALRFVRTLPPK